MHVGAAARLVPTAGSSRRRAVQSTPFGLSAAIPSSSRRDSAWTAGRRPWPRKGVRVHAATTPGDDASGFLQCRRSRFNPKHPFRAFQASEGSDHRCVRRKRANWVVLTTGKTAGHLSTTCRPCGVHGGESVDGVQRTGSLGIEKEQGVHVVTMPPAGRWLTLATKRGSACRR